MGESDFVPRRVPGGYFKPHPETMWPALDGGDPTGDAPIPAHVATAGWSAYVNLLTHPCGIDMLRNARRGWKALRKAERASEASRG